MKEDHHFKWSSDPLCICLYLGLNSRPLCPRRVCYLLGHSGRAFEKFKKYQYTLAVKEIQNLTLTLFNSITQLGILTFQNNATYLHKVPMSSYKLGTETVAVLIVFRTIIKWDYQKWVLLQPL